MVQNRSFLTSTTPVAGSPSSSSPSGGLACAIAALAERQQTGAGTSINYIEDMSTHNMPGSRRYLNREDQESGSYYPAESGNVDNQMEMTGEWVDQRSDMAEVGTSYGGSDEFDGVVVNSCGVPQEEENQCSGQPFVGPIIPESFEEQMMLAMAVSLAEARARTSTPGVASWH